MPGHYIYSSLIAAILAEQFELANSLSEQYAGQATPETARITIHHLNRALELVRVVRAHLAVRAASVARQSAYESAVCAPGLWTIEA